MFTNIITCKCCKNQAEFIGNIDFNKTCHDRIAGRVFSISEILIPYYACKTCGFVFTPHMDDWSMNDFKSRIYNDEYSKADAPLAGYENVDRRETISYKNGVRLANLLAGSQDKIHILDYGSGGNPGDTGLALIDQGFKVDSYEPYFVEDIQLSSNTYNFIYLIEVFEHCHEIDKVADYLSKNLSPDGLLYIQTLLHPFPTPNDVLDSWYISPRNGHISIFTFKSLVLLFMKHRINIVNTIFGIIGFREKPKFPNSFLL